MVVRVITGLRTALEMSRVTRVRVVGERRSGTPKRHGQRQHERRDQQRNALPRLLSPPFAHSRQHHRPLERDAWRGQAHAIKPHPFAMLGGGALSLGLCRDPTTVRQPGYLSSLEERPMGFAPPPHGGFAFIAAPERQSARGLSY